MEFRRQHSKHHQRLIFIQDLNQFHPTADHRPISLHFRDYDQTFRKRHRASLNIITKGSSLPWDIVLNNQPDWKSSFMKGITLKEPIPDIIDAIIQSDFIYVVSDGSAKGNQMTYGWVMYTSNKNILATGQGPCAGRPSSMRGEAGGMLSPILFLSTLQDISNHAMGKPRIRFIADNQSLITRECQHQDYKDPYPNYTLKAEFDLTEQIYQSINDADLQATFQHVKGHQDDHQEYNKLSFEAQLNVQADELAEDFYGKFNFQPNVPMLPACPAVLEIKTVTVTNDFRNQLQKAWTEPNYLTYLEQKFDWSPDVMESIAWRSLSIALNRIRNDVVTFKICNDILPTASSLQRRQYQYHNSCCLCGEQENTEHLIRCLDQTRNKWRVHYITTLKNRLKLFNTKPGITDTLCTAITEWFDTCTVTISKYHPKYHSALQSQLQIGWRHIFTGKLSTK